MMLTLYFLFWSLMLSQPGLALHQPYKSAYDTRIRSVTYNPQDVIQLDCVIGIATHIVLEEGETYITHAFGDAKAYSFSVERHHLFLKPKAENADTNLIVVTDRRSYNFRLTFCPTPLGSTAVYQLEFRYPETKTKQDQEAEKKKKLAQGFQKKPPFYNLDYTMSGDLDLAPLHVWDNQAFTYFKFPNSRDLPTLYMVDEEGQESIVNRHVEGPHNATLVVHKINAKWVLRLADRALAIYNESYDTQGIIPTTGTTSTTVKRVVKGDPHGDSKD